ncbi:DoxX family protein [Flavitalea antarctica]
MKIWKIITVVATVLAVSMVILSGVMKFIGGEEITTAMEKFGVLPYLLVLGSMEIIFALLFLFRPTMKIGFILLTCYFSGALATELSHGMPLNAVLPLALVWISALLRDKTIFFPMTATPVPKF